MTGEKKENEEERKQIFKEKTHFIFVTFYIKIYLLGSSHSKVKPC